jgi:hypothetical protein
MLAMRPRSDYGNLRKQVLAAPLASAQTNPNRERHTAVNTAITSETIQADQIRASKVLGSSVYDLQKLQDRRVKDLVLNKDGTVAAVVVDVGSLLGMGGRDVAVPLSDIKTDSNRPDARPYQGAIAEGAGKPVENRNTRAGISTSPVQGGRLGTGSSTDR